MLRKVQDEEENEWLFTTTYDFLSRFYCYHFVMFLVSPKHQFSAVSVV